MSHTVSEAMQQVRAGRAHMRLVFAGDREPIEPVEMPKSDKFLRSMFAKGALEIYEKEEKGTTDG